MTSLATQPANKRQRSKGPSRLSQRASDLLRKEIDFIPNQSFLERQAAAPPAPLPAEGPLPKAVANLPAHLARLCTTSLLNPDEESSLFKRMNYLKFRANALRSRLNPQRPDANKISAIEDLLSEVKATRDRLIQANMRLVISVVKKYVTPQMSFDDLLSEGIFALMHAVDKFDYDRGFRFSTYAYRAIARSCYRVINNRQREAARLATVGDESVFEAAEGARTSSLDEHTWSRLRELLSGMINRLDRRDQLIIRCRYALGVHRKVRSFQRIADKLGLSKERVRQLEQRAVARLKTMAQESCVEADEQMALGTV